MPVLSFQVPTVKLLRAKSAVTLASAISSYHEFEKILLTKRKRLEHNSIKFSISYIGRL